MDFGESHAKPRYDRSPCGAAKPTAGYNADKSLPGRANDADATCRNPISDGNNLPIIVLAYVCCQPIELPRLVLGGEVFVLGQLARQLHTNVHEFRVLVETVEPCAAKPDAPTVPATQTNTPANS